MSEVQKSAGAPPHNRIAGEFAGAELVRALSRPPWHVGSTAEISRAAGIPFGRLSNWICRGQFVRPEPRYLFRLRGNRSVFRLDHVTEWLSGIAPLEQAAQYLVSVGLQPTSAHADVWDHVRMLERDKVFVHAWRPRDLESYLATI